MTPPRRSSSSLRRLLPLLGLAALAGGCTVADNLTAGEILHEFDGIVAIDTAGSEPKVRYAEKAPVTRWYARWCIMQPVRWPLVWVFGLGSEQKIEQPATHVRELLVELPDEVGGDLLVGAQAASRLGWIAEFEPNAQSRLVGIDGLAAVARDLTLPLFAGDFARLGAAGDEAAHAAAKVVVERHQPKARQGGILAAADREAYLAALPQWTAAPLANGAARLERLELATALLAAEDDDELRTATATAVRAAMAHLVEGVLLRIVQGRAPEYVDLRLCAMEHIRRLGGPRAVPLLLAVMAATASEFARGESRYDPDPQVQLRLIHYCGQLTGELAQASVQLPNRTDVLPLAPVDFLANTILTERAYYSKLRVPAIVALTWSLQRPRLDPDPGWVREWREQRR